jgi:hypothetical protein
MPVETIHYRFYDSFEMQIRRQRRRDVCPDLNLQFSFFEVPQVDAPDLVCDLRGGWRSRDDGVLVDHKYLVGDGYLYCQDRDRHARWQVEIQGIEGGPLCINYDGRVTGPAAWLAPDYLPQSMLLRPALQHGLLQKGILILHALGVSDSHHAYVLAGRGGSFKTSLGMDFSRILGFQLCGDDLLALSGRGVLPLPTHPFLLEFRMRHMPNERYRGGLDRVRAFLYMRSRSRERDPEMPAFIQRTAKPLGVLFLVKRSLSAEAVGVRQIARRDAVQMLVANNQLEMVTSPYLFGLDFGRYQTYMDAYAFVYPQSRVARYWDEFAVSLDTLLGGVTCCELILPYRYSRRVFEQVAEAIRAVGG